LNESGGKAKEITRQMVGTQMQKTSATQAGIP